MTDARNDPRLVLKAEGLLAQATVREPDFEALAERITAALGTAGPTDDTLLLPPLPESIEDGRLAPSEAPTETARERPAVALAPIAVAPIAVAPIAVAPIAVAPVAVAPIAVAPVAVAPVAVAPTGKAPIAVTEPASSQREGASLAELARAAVARREANDAKSLAKEAFAIASQQRVPADLPAPAAIVTERDRQTLPPSRRARPVLDTRGPWIGVAVGALGLAAGFGLYLSGNSSKTAPIPVAEVTARTVPSAPATVAAESPGVAPPVTPDMLPTERQAAPSETPVVVPEALARETPAAKSSAAVAEPRPAASDGRAAATGEAHAKAEKIVLEEDHTPDHTAPAGATAVPSSKPGTTPGLKPAELNANGGVPDRPSTGAAQAAVGAVLGAARSCIAGQAQGSSATLVFGSSGVITSVAVSGPAEGTPAASCIESALKKARVQPFAAPSFSLGVTVRPP